jgi:hypothetical protein
MRPEVRVLYHPPHALGRPARLELAFTIDWEVAELERARELIKPYLDMKGLIGIYVVGSSTRPFRDGLSDYDIEVVVEDDVYAKLPDEERHVFVIEEGPPRRVDHEFYLRPWSEYAALLESPQDLFHYPYQHAVVLHDPNGRVTGVAKRLAALPEGVRAVRLRVHYLEFLFALGRARKTGERGGDLNVRLIYGQGLAAVVKLLFLLYGSWPATPHWTQQELRLLGVPDELVTQIAGAFAAPTKERLSALTDAVKAELEAHGETFHKDPQALMHWAYLHDEGKKAFSTWGWRY